MKTDIFAALETTSIVIFDAQTGLRFVDETLPEQIEDAAEIVSDAVKTAVEKRNETYGAWLVASGLAPKWARGIADLSDAGNLQPEFYKNLAPGDIEDFESFSRNPSRVVSRKQASIPYKPQYGVIVICDTEKHQEEVYGTLKKEGYQCRVVTT